MINHSTYLNVKKDELFGVDLLSKSKIKTSNT